MTAKKETAKPSIYFHYSPATDVTGKKLAEKFSASHGSTVPTAAFDFFVGWGAKTSKSVVVNSKNILNHPDAIRANRNKLMALTLMKNAGVSVAPFIPASDFDKVGAVVKLPIIARTSFHQGGKGFWNCPTLSMVKNAVKEGAEYLQNLIEIEDEYRIHVFNGKVIYAVKKVKRTAEETAEAFVTQELTKQKAIAEKAGKQFDEATAVDLLTRQSKMFAQNGANMLVRSNRLGWKFVKVKALKDDIGTEAVKAVTAVGLNFGAVDCCVDVTGKVFILEVNSGPGLEETTFDLWVKAFEEVLCPKATTTPAPTVSTGAAQPKGKASSKKEEMLAQIDMARRMLEVADDGEETAAVGNVFKKLFG